MFNNQYIKRKTKSVATVSLLILLLAIACLRPIYLDITSTQSKIAEQVKREREIQWSFIESAIQSHVQIANAKAVESGDLLKKALLEKYPNPQDLRRVLDDVESNSSLSVVANDSITDKYMFGGGDSNDQFVGIVYYPIKGDPTGAIIADKSKDCAVVDSPLKTWRVVRELSYNKELAGQAIDAMVAQNDIPLFWQFSQPEDVSYVTRTMELDSLKKLFMQYGSKSLYSYEILVPYYITNDGDILGVHDVSAKGTVNKTRKLLVVQGFNLGDMIDNSVATLLAESDYNINLIVESATREQHAKQQMLFALIVLCSVVLLSNINIQNTLAEISRYYTDKSK